MNYIVGGRGGVKVGALANAKIRTLVYKRDVCEGG